MEMNVMVWDSHNNSAGLNQLISTLPFLIIGSPTALQIKDA
jgi:hypothetical protein